MKRIVLLCLLLSAPIVPAADEVPLKGLVATLPETPPVAGIGRRDGLLQEVWYESVPLRGKPTRVFGWLGRPAAGGGKAPAMVLVSYTFNSGHLLDAAPTAPMPPGGGKRCEGNASAGVPSGAAPQPYRHNGSADAACQLGGQTPRGHLHWAHYAWYC